MTLFNLTEQSLETSPAAPLARQQEALFADGVVSRQLIDALPQAVVVINARWQVVYANPAVLTIFDLPGRQRPVGIQTGEAFHCVHSRTHTGTGPTAPSCRVCGVARAVALSLQGRDTVSDCRLTCDLSGSSVPLELRVSATALSLGEERYAMVALSDIGAEKRRAMLANVCFHDLLNTLTSIRGLLDVLKDADVVERPEICELLEQTTLGSIDEITTLRLLEQAEECTLSIHRDEVDTGKFTQKLVKTLQRHPQARGKMLCLATTAEAVLYSDRNLLRRVIGNMILNALEATEAGGTVTVNSRCCEGQVEFSVHNCAAIPLEIQPQIFTRSFSTKGEGRGFGTYSVQLLSSLLGGHVAFDSSPDLGTIFRASFPMQVSD